VIPLVGNHTSHSSRCVVAHPVSALCREKHVAFEVPSLIPWAGQTALAGWKDFVVSTVRLCSLLQFPHPRFGMLSHVMPRSRVGVSLHVCGKTCEDALSFGHS